MTQHATSQAKFFYDENTINKLIRADNKIYGLLGRSVPPTVNTAAEDIANLKGKYGENIIGSLLNILALEYDDMYVFHSVSTPGNVRGETDHILLYKNKLILVETKTYNNFKAFRIDKEGHLSGVPSHNPKLLRKLDNNNLIQKTMQYQHFFQNFQPHAITAVARAGVQTTSENGKYKVASLDTLIHNLNYHQAQAKPISVEETENAVRFLARTCLPA